jgi:hypothetical protein
MWRARLGLLLVAALGVQAGPRDAIAASQQSKGAAAPVPRKSPQRPRGATPKPSRATLKPKAQRAAPHRAKARPSAPRPRRHRPIVAAPTNAPALRYAALDGAACLAELDARQIEFRAAEATPGVVTPLRLTAPLNGVLYRTDYADAARASTPYEIYDCRLVLALYDWSAQLTAAGFVEVRHFSAYRPPPRNARADVGKRHHGGLALDVRALRRVDGTELTVLAHFNGRIGGTSCGPRATAPSPATAEAKELRAVLCRAAEAGIFNSVLTPHTDAPHRNHFHLELTPGVSWMMVD